MSNSIGEYKSIEEIEQYVNELLEEWQNENPSKPWWKFWVKSKINLAQVTVYLLNSADELIKMAEEYIESGGADKKATVMAIMAYLYDHVAKEAMPFWLKPLSPAIRNLILSVIISYAIDWIVKKYNDREFIVEDDPTKFTKFRKRGNK